MWKDVLLSRSIRLLHSHCLFCVLPRDPNPKVERLYETDREDHTLRVQNFSILNRHIRAFYQVGEVHWGRRVSHRGSDQHEWSESAEGVHAQLNRPFCTK